MEPSKMNQNLSALTVQTSVKPAKTILFARPVRTDFICSKIIAQHNALQTTSKIPQPTHATCATTLAKPVAALLLKIA